MNCNWQEKIDAFVDAELPVAEAADMEAHLHGCAFCAAEALERLRSKRLIQAAAATHYTPSPEFRLKIGQLVVNGTIRHRATIIQRKTKRPL